MLTSRAPRAPVSFAAVLLFFALVPALSPSQTEPASEARAEGVLRKGDRVAFVGSSSTRIGVWPRTVEFLLRTRHPELKLQFERFSTGGGTFSTGLEHMDVWLERFKPTVVIFNYGGNDAGAGVDGLPNFKRQMQRSFAKARTRGARVVFVTPQAADERKSGRVAAANRTLYAETMLAYGREKGWNVVDIHHPLDAMQRANQAADPSYSILRDSIHLTHAAYVGWGFLAYDRLDLPFVRSSVEMKADGQVTSLENCEVIEVKRESNALAFTRIDSALPILPPGPLPPRYSAPLEAHSRYMLRVAGLDAGAYEILCAGRPVGVVDASELAAGVNLNTLLIEGRKEAPWQALSNAVWNGQRLERIGQTRWRFEVRKQ